MPSPLSFKEAVLVLMQGQQPIAETHSGDRCGCLYGQSSPYFLYRTSLKELFDPSYAYRFLVAQEYAKDNKATFVEVYERDDKVIPYPDMIRDALYRCKSKRAISVTKIFSFAYAHQLSSFELNEADNCAVYGKCHKNLKSQIHGHNAKLEVTIKGWPSVVTGMVMNFNELKERVNRVIDQLDHTNLLDNIDLMKKGPSTCENSLHYLWEELKKDIPILEKLKLYETDTSYAEIERSDYE